MNQTADASDRPPGKPAGIPDPYADAPERAALLAQLREEQRRLADLTEELRRERDLQQQLMENTNASVVYLDRDFNFVRMNAAYEVACQRPRTDMIGRNHFELFPDAENEAIFRQVRDTGQPVVFVAKPFEFADQPWRGVTYWDWTLTPVKAAAGEVAGLVFSLVDVTERVQGQKLSDALHEIHAAIASKVDFDEIMQTLLEQSAAALSCDGGAVSLREDGCWAVRYGVGPSARFIGLPFSNEQALPTMQAAQTRLPVAVLEGETAVELSRDVMARYGLSAVLAVPLVVRGKAAGVLTFNFTRPRMAFTETELDFAARLAAVATLTLENARVLELESSQRQMAERRAAELEATFEAISDGVMIYSSDGRIVRQNAAAARLLSYQPSDLDLPMAERKARRRVELVNDATASPEQIPAARALRGETVRGELMRFYNPDHPEGAATYVLVSAAPIRDRSGVSLGAVFSMTDVSELRRARDELAARVGELEALLELVPVGIAICYDPEGKDIRANPANTRMLAMPRDANLSLRLDDGEREPPYRVFDPAGRELAVDELPVQVAARGVEVRDRVLEVLRGDGVKITLLSCATPVLDAAGHPRGAVAAFVDISPLRAAEVERERLLGELRERSRELESRNEEIRALNADLELRVQERTAELEAIFASMPDALYVADRTRVTRCNQAALDSFGVESVDELSQSVAHFAETMQVRQADTGEPVPAKDLVVLRALQGEQAAHEVITRHFVTGQERFLRVAAAPIVLDGKIVGAVGTAVDITQQRQAQLQLAYQANLLARMSDAVVATDLEYCISSWNHAAEEMFGWQEAEVLGRPIADTLPTEFVDISPAEVYRQLAAQGQWRGEMRITRRDGGQVDVEAIGVPVRDASGKIIGQVGVDRDITAQKRAQAQIAYQAKLLDNVNDAIFAYDGAFRITAWNRCAEEQYGWRAEEVLGTYAPEVVGSQMTNEQRAGLMRTLAETGRWQGEIQHTRRDGTPFIVETTSMALRDDAGQITTYVTVNRDITGRKETEAQNARLLEELRVSREQLRALSQRLVATQEAERSYVADQLYNQVGQVLAALQMQLSRLGKEDEVRTPAAQTRVMQATLSGAIRELHDLAMQLRPVGLDHSSLARVLEGYLSAFGRRLGLAVQFYAGNAEALRAPTEVGTAIFRAVEEGLTNVAQHAHATQVALSMSQDAGVLTVTLTDNGVGFDPLTAAGRGGLGLATIRERLQTVSGQLKIESGRAGTCLRIQAPLDNEEC